MANRQPVCRQRSLPVAPSLPDLSGRTAFGGRPQRLTHHPAEDVSPSWSRHGRWIYFASTRGGKQSQVLPAIPPS